MQAIEATQKVTEQLKISKNINYDALKQLLGTGDNGDGDGDASGDGGDAEW